MLYAVVAVAALFAVAWLVRHEDLFCLSVRDGRVLVVRGCAPPGFVSDVRDIAAREGVRDATVRAVKTERGGRLLFSGDLSEGTQQRLRNVFGILPAAQLRHAPPIKNPTLGQALGIAWLAWILDSSSRD
jgi:hypothetical protein